jgi:hypothetical protein
MPARHQFFKDLAQHLRIDRDLDVERRGLGDREVEAIQQIAQDQLEAPVGHAGIRAAVVLVLFEQATVQVGHVPNQRSERMVIVDAGDVDLVRVIETGEEEQLQPVAVEVLLGERILAIGLP